MALAEEEKGDKEILRETVIEKLNSLKKKKFDASLVDDFSWAFNVFLKRHLNLDYEFTYEELLGEIGKAKLKEDLKSRILGLSNFMQEIKYGNVILTKEHFEWMVDEGKRIINLAIMGKELAEEKAEKGARVKSKREGEEKSKELDRRKKEKEKAEREKLREKKRRERRKKILNFFHSLGLVKTDDEKRGIERKRQRDKRQRELEIRKRERKRIKHKELRLKEQEAKREKAEEERRKQKELEEKSGEFERGVKEGARREREKLSKDRVRKIRKNIFNFFHSLGPVKTKRGKREIESKKQRQRELQELKRKMAEQERKRMELDVKRKKELEKKRKEEEKKAEGKRKREIEIKRKGKSWKFVKCHKLLLMSHEAIQNNNIQNAKRLYLKSRGLYTKLEYLERKEIYDDIMNLYNKFGK